jgi:hypothetical protein
MVNCFAGVSFAIKSQVQIKNQLADLGRGRSIEAGASIYVGRTSPFDRDRSELWCVIKCKISICIKDIARKERIGSVKIIEAGASIYKKKGPAIKQGPYVIILY